MDPEGTQCNQSRAANWIEKLGPDFPWVIGNVRNVNWASHTVKREKRREDKEEALYIKCGANLCLASTFHKEPERLAGPYGVC